jgi:hypothetical protein
MKTIIHVNRNILAANKKYKKSDPAIIIRTWKGTRYCKKVRVGNVTFVQNEEKPLSCGARIWAETESGDIEILES